MTTTEMISKVRELKDLKIMLNELEAEITSIEDEIKAEMNSQNRDELIVDVFTIRYKTITSSRFDSKTFKSQHADMYAAYSKPTTTKRFTIN